MDFNDPRKPNATTYVKKGWGIEGVERCNEHQYSLHGRCGEVYAWHYPDELKRHQFHAETVKILYFGLNKKLSLHVHRDKEELFTVALGNIEVTTIDKQGKKTVVILQAGDRIFIPQCMPHQMRGLNEKNILIEVSTLHHDEDSYRIEKGD